MDHQGRGWGHQGRGWGHQGREWGHEDRGGVVSTSDSDT